MAVLWYNNWTPTYSGIVNFPIGTATVTNKYAQNRQLSDRTRWVFSTPSPEQDQAARWIAYTSSSTPFTGGGVSILNHNCPEGSLAQVRLSNTGWGGTDVANVSVTMDHTGARPGQNINTFVDLGANYSAKYWNIYVWTHDVGSYGAQGADVSVGGIDIGYRVELDCSINYSETIKSVGGTLSASGGETSSWTGSNGRSATLDLTATTDAQLWGTSSEPDACLMSMEQAIGNHGSITVLPYGNESDKLNTQRGIYGHISRSSPAQIRDIGSGGVLATKSITIEEEK